jgi:hypothetical protein
VGSADVDPVLALNGSWHRDFSQQIKVQLARPPASRARTQLPTPPINPGASANRFHPLLHAPDNEDPPCRPANNQCHGPNQRPALPHPTAPKEAGAGAAGAATTGATAAAAGKTGAAKAATKAALIPAAVAGAGKQPVATAAVGAGSTAVAAAGAGAAGLASATKRVVAMADSTAVNSEAATGRPLRARINVTGADAAATPATTRPATAARPAAEISKHPATEAGNGEEAAVAEETGAGSIAAKEAESAATARAQLDSRNEETAAAEAVEKEGAAMGSPPRARAGRTGAAAAEGTAKARTEPVERPQAAGGEAPAPQSNQMDPPRFSEPMAESDSDSDLLEQLDSTRPHQQDPQEATASASHPQETRQPQTDRASVNKTQPLRSGPPRAVKAKPGRCGSDGQSGSPGPSASSPSLHHHRHPTAH